jgi:hypothetical protein
MLLMLFWDVQHRQHAPDDRLIDLIDLRIKVRHRTETLMVLASECFGDDKLVGPKHSIYIYMNESIGSTMSGIELTQFDDMGCLLLLKFDLAPFSSLENYPWQGR